MSDIVDIRLFLPVCAPLGDYVKVIESATRSAISVGKIDEAQALSAIECLMRAGMTLIETSTTAPKLWSGAAPTA